MNVYFDLIRRRPLTTNVATSILVSVTGDFLCQRYEHFMKTKSEDFVIDRRRAGAMLFWGGTFVPICWGKFFKVVDFYFPKKSFLHVFVKVTLAATCMTPIMNVLYMTFAISLENHEKAYKNVKEMIFTKIKNDLAAVVLQSAQIWVPLNIMNFAFFPPHLRLFFTTVANVGWNAYISFVVHQPSGPGPGSDP